MPRFVYKELQIEYKQWGQGSEVVVFFHGFGRTLEDAVFFLPLLKPHQSLVSVSLFGHGESTFPAKRLEKDPLQPEEWESLMEAFMGHFGVPTIHLVGYSMGGRVAMVTALLLQDKARSLLLLAPDGFKINPLYTFASGTRLGRRLYRYFMNRPSGLFRLAAALNAIGLLSDKLLRFVHVHLDTREKRELVHDAWLVYRAFFPNLHEVGSWVDNLSTSFAAVFGRYDAIIPSRLANRLEPKIHRIPKTSWFFEVDLGHRLLEKKTMDCIEKNGLWP
jgi:pimeloyl-ACP methyl ester carboxylesterase